MADITSMLVAFGQSIDPIEKFASGLAYLMGIFFFIHALAKLRPIADRRARDTSGRGGFIIPAAYILAGAALLYLPTSIHVMETTLFGSYSPLAYNSWIEEWVTKYSSPGYIVTQLIEMAGVIWFVRGCVLLAASSDPGVQHGMRGFVFLIAGVLAINFLTTFSIIEATMESITTGTHALYPLLQKE